MASNGSLKNKYSEQVNYEPARTLLGLAKEQNLEVTDEAFARLLDQQDELRNLRDEFHYPKMKDLPLGKFRIATE